LAGCFGTVGYGDGAWAGINGDMGLVVAGRRQAGVGNVCTDAPRPEPSVCGDGSHTPGSGRKSGPDPAGIGGRLEGGVPAHHGDSRFNSGISGTATGRTNGSLTGTDVGENGLVSPNGPPNVGLTGRYETGRKGDESGCVAGVGNGGGTTGSITMSFSSSSSSYTSLSCTTRRGISDVALLFLCLRVRRCSAASPSQPPSPSSPASLSPASSITARLFPARSA
jgi:hypothetical protein